MGIEPTRDPYGPHTDFEDQGRHQAPITSAIILLLLPISLAVDTTADSYFTHVGHNAGGLPL